MTFFSAFFSSRKWPSSTLNSSKLVSYLSFRLSSATIKPEIKPMHPARNRKSAIYFPISCFNSLGILFDQVDLLDNVGLLHECSSYLFGAIYNLFRIIYSSNPKNPKGIFSIPEHIYRGRLHAMQSISENNAESIANGLPITEYRSLERSKQTDLSPEIINEQYTTMSESLFTLIQSTEKRIMK